MASKHESLDALFTDIADAIREKTGDTETIPAAEFPGMIREKFEYTRVFHRRIYLVYLGWYDYSVFCYE